MELAGHSRERALGLGLLVGALLLLNVADAYFTLLVVHSGLATEANPLMAQLLERGPLAFVLGKHLLVSICVVALWHLRSHRLAAAGMKASVSTYALLVLYHVGMNLTIS